MPYWIQLNSGETPAELDKNHFSSRDEAEKYIEKLKQDPKNAKRKFKIHKTENVCIKK